MKSFKTLTLALSFALIGAASAHAAPLTKSAELTLFNLDQRFSGGFSENSGTISIDRTNKTITLSVQAEPKCDVGSFCPRGFQQIIDTTLPIRSKKTGSCGETIYSAKQDLRPADGIYESIEVRDFSTSNCPTFRSVPTSVIYITKGHLRMGNETFETLSTFEGEELKSTFPRISPIAVDPYRYYR